MTDGLRTVEGQAAGPLLPDLLATIHAQVFPAEERWDAGAMADLLAMPGTFVILRDHAGFVMARLAAEEAEILTLAVLPAFRRQGIARCLMMAATDHAATRGTRQMFLEVSVGNAPALALYAGLGFARIGLRRGYYPDGGDAAVMAWPSGAVA